MAETAADTQAKRFAPEAGKGSVYVFRDGNLVGSGLTLELTVDGRMAGALAPKTYGMLSLSPGQHVITLAGFSNMAQQKVAVEVGKIYFFQASTSLGWNPGGVRNLAPISAEEGQKQVLQYKRADFITYD